MEPWVYQPNVFANQQMYDTLLRELQPYLTVGKVKVFGKEYDESRKTCYFSFGDGQMNYSGRTLDPVRPPEGSMIENLMHMVNDVQFRENAIARDPVLANVIPEFNAVFINWYRPPGDTPKNDGLGPHSDDERYLASQVILSITFCGENGERIFRFHNKKDGTTTTFELPDGSALWMLPGCQQLYKHSVSNRKTNLAGRRITGGRLNFTFRCVK